MYAIVEVKGKQYKVEKGQNILIEYLGEDAKESPEIKTLLLKKDDESVIVGTPYIENVKVNSKIVESLKGDKVIIGKHKRRKDYRRKTGHRHKYHKITIEDIPQTGDAGCKSEIHKQLPSGESTLRDERNLLRRLRSRRGRRTAGIPRGIEPHCLCPI